MRKVNEEFRLQIEQFKLQIEQFKLEIEDLKAKLSTNSSNSSLPPSSDLFNKQRSLRKPTGKSKGGQKGRKGHHLARVDNPDHIINHFPKLCSSCKSTLNHKLAEKVSSKQIFDLPRNIAIEVVEHQVMSIKCNCGKVTSGSYPENITATVSYGPNIRAYVAYLSSYQYIPVERIKELLSDILNIDISTGTIMNMVLESNSLLANFDQVIKDSLIESELIHADETGLRVDSKNNWAHSVSNEFLSLFKLDNKRGSIAIDNIGVIPNSSGTVVHDGYQSYKKYENVTHSLCNAHHLRELKLIYEQLNESWAKEMSDLLISALDKVTTAKNSYKSRLSTYQITKIKRNYRKILEKGYLENPPHETIKRQRGRPKHSKTYNLLKRLSDYEDDVLRFATDFSVPFDNNLAERDIRMVKLKQKVSGGFRTKYGAEAFLALRSYISTAKKQQQNIMEVLIKLYNGNGWIPENLTNT